MNGIKGDGPYTHGSSYANGPLVPAWLGWELAEVQAFQYSSWTVMA